jgi:hypothetical protein
MVEQLFDHLPERVFIVKDYSRRRAVVLRRNHRSNQKSYWFDWL